MKGLRVEIRAIRLGSAVKSLRLGISGFRAQSLGFRVKGLG